MIASLLSSMSLDHTPSELSSDVLQAALAIAGVACVIWSPENSQLIFSENFHDQLGLSRSNLPQTEAAWEALTHPDDLSHLHNITSLLAQSGDWQKSEQVVRFKHSDGAWLSFNVKAQTHISGESAAPRLIITFSDITRQKQTEAALKDSQLRYRALHTTSPLAFIVWDRQGHIAEWNRRAEDLFGWKTEEVIGKQVHRLLVPASELDNFRHAIKTLSQHHSGHVNFSGPTYAKDGFLRHCHWYNVALRSPQGHLTGILSLILDVTEEKVAQDAVTKSEKIYRTLVETSPDGILLLALDGRLTMANQQAQTLFSLDLLEDIGSTHIRDLLPRNALQDPALCFTENPEEFSGFIMNKTLDMRRLDDKLFEAAISFTTIMGSDGMPAGIVLFVRDITEKRRVDRELEAHRHNLEKLVQDRTLALEHAHDALAQIIDGSPVPTFVLNAHHEVTHWNKACEKIIGANAMEMIGTRNQWKAFYPHPRPVMADLVMTGEIDLVERLYQTKYKRSSWVPGAYEAEDYFPTFNRWLYFTAAPLKDVNGNIIGAIETLQDVSERKKAELALQDAKSIAELAANTKAEFLANMSHEIRTPMNAVIGLAHLLNKTDLSTKQSDYVTRIRGAGEILLRLINDVLDFSKIEAGRMQLENVEFNLDDVLSNVATIVVTRAQEKGLELHYAVEPEVPQTLLGDPLRFTQILVNLIGNAIKFTEKGDVTAFLRRIQANEDRILLEVDIQDTGIGMSIDQQGKLFQAFTQADTSITRHYGGTGLGLTISKRLVEMMNGRIWVTSQPGIGSTFSFQLELGIVKTLPPTLECAEPAIQRALVVDDNPLARTVLTRLLQKYGCLAEGVDCGEAALAHLSQSKHPYDFVTVDLNMPGMNGLALAEAIHAQQPTKPPKLVLVTASDTHALEEAGALKLFHMALNKPITAAQIGQLLSGKAPGKDDGLPDAENSPLKGYHVLLAEDIPTNQLIASEMLQSFGMQVTTAENGRIAIEAVEKAPNRFDLILMDMQMPEVDGIAATQKIRLSHSAAALPIIAMTAHALDEERERYLSNGMNDFITKPVDPKKLFASLLRWKPEHPKGAPTQTKQPAGNTPAMTIPPLPGIDTANGLKRMMNKTILYERVLRDFHKRFSGEAALIRAALAAQDHHTAERHAHSTKGLADSIGALALQSISKTLEEAIKRQEAYPEQELQDYEAELKIVIDGIGAAYQLDN